MDRLLVEIRETHTIGAHDPLRERIVAAAQAAGYEIEDADFATAFAHLPPDTVIPDALFDAAAAAIAYLLAIEEGAPEGLNRR